MHSISFVGAFILALEAVPVLLVRSGYGVLGARLACCLCEILGERGADPSAPAARLRERLAKTRRLRVASGCNTLASKQPRKSESKST